MLLLFMPPLFSSTLFKLPPSMPRAGVSGVGASVDFPRNEAGPAGPASKEEAGGAPGGFWNNPPALCGDCWARRDGWKSSFQGLATEEALLALLGELTSNGIF